MQNVLKKKNFSNIFKSIRFFYPVKTHPEYLSNPKIGIYLIFKKFFIRQFLYLKECSQNFFYKKNFVKNKKDVLILSHLINKDHLNKKDFYFGNLLNILKKKKINCQFLLINHTNINSTFLNLALNNKDVWILENYLSFFFEIKIFFLQIKETINIIFNFHDFKNFSKKKIIFSLFNSETKKAIRLHYTLSKYLEKINPKKFITTFEGFPWERLAFKAVKNFDQNIKTFGYQNVFLSKNYESIRYKLNYGYDPDVIWLSGSDAKKFFKNTEYKKKNLIVVGKLNLEKINNFKIKFKKNKLISCLVLPEGIYSECYKLFKFSYQCSKLNKNINYIWRVHPVINFKKVLNLLKIQKQEKLPNNIIISKEKHLFKDILKSNFVLYRGSNAVLSAIKAGLIPIYFEINKEINIDLLNNCNQFVNYVNSPEEFVEITHKIKKKRKHITKLINFINKNESKINEKEILKSILF